jgi:Na+-driven multidrug efflux pump
MYAAQNLGGRRPDRIRRGVVEATWMAIVGGAVIGALIIAFGVPMVRLFIGEGSDGVVGLAHLMLIVNGLGSWALGVLFVLRGALQGLGHTLVPTVTGVIELVARVAAAVILGSLIAFPGVALSNPLAWVSAILLLVPAYIRAHRELGQMPVNPVEATETSAIAIVGPVDGSMVVDAVVTQPVRVLKRSRLARLRRR